MKERPHGARVGASPSAVAAAHVGVISDNFCRTYGVHIVAFCVVGGR
jgi:hypothetical protein